MTKLTYEQESRMEWYGKWPSEPWDGYDEITLQLGAARSVVLSFYRYDGPLDASETVCELRIFNNAIETAAELIRLGLLDAMQRDGTPDPVLDWLASIGAEDISHFPRP